MGQAYLKDVNPLDGALVAGEGTGDHARGRGTLWSADRGPHFRVRRKNVKVHIYGDM